MHEKPKSRQQSMSDSSYFSYLFAKASRLGDQINIYLFNPAMIGDLVEPNPSSTSIPAECLESTQISTMHSPKCWSAAWPVASGFGPWTQMFHLGYHRNSRADLWPIQTCNDQSHCNSPLTLVPTLARKHRVGPSFNLRVDSPWQVGIMSVLVDKRCGTSKEPSITETPRSAKNTRSSCGVH